MKQAAREAVMSSYTGSPAGMANTSAVQRMCELFTLTSWPLYASIDFVHLLCWYC